MKLKMIIELAQQTLDNSVALGLNVKEIITMNYILTSEIIKSADHENNFKIEEAKGTDRIDKVFEASKLILTDGVAYELDD